MTSHETRWSSIRRQFILYHAFSGIASPILRGDGKARICLGLMRLPALTRRCAALLYMIVDRRPAQYRVWPVAAPAEAFVRAGLVCAALCVRTCWLKRGREYRFSLLFIMEDGVYKGGSCEVCLGHCAVMRAFGVLRCGSVGGHAGHTALLERFAFDHAGFAVLLRCGCAWHGKGRSGTTETCPAPISGGRTAAGRASRVAARSLLCAQSFESGRVKWKPHYTPRAAQYA